MRRGRTIVTGLMLAVLLAACGEPSYVVTDLNVEQASWEQVTASAEFGRQTLFGGADAVQPDTTYAYLFDSRYDTLYAGPTGLIAVPDERLASEEALLVEICGRIGGQTVCRQRGFTASPKRIDAAPEIEYPEDEDTGQARYQLDVRVERQRFDSTGWEPIDVPSLDLFARAYVQGSDEHTVEVPMARGEGHLQLSGRAGYDDFAFALNSSLYDANSADVHFDVFAGINGQANRLAEVVRTVREKAASERRRDVAELARLAAGHLLERLAEGRRPRASVYVDDWRFNTITDRYTIRFELVWEDGHFFSRRKRIDGTLTTRAGGRDAAFELDGGTRRGRERWDERVGTATLELPRLTTPEEGMDAPDAAAQAERGWRRRGR